MKLSYDLLIRYEVYQILQRVGSSDLRTPGLREWRYA
jgi:hypothetical protein